MLQQGSIVRWDSERGFGFIRSASTQTEVFFHARDFRGAPEPVLRMDVEYEEIHVGGKGPRAMAVRPRETAESAVGESHSSRSRIRIRIRSDGSSTLQAARSSGNGNGSSGSSPSRQTSQPSHAGSTGPGGRGARSHSSHSSHSRPSASAHLPAHRAGRGVRTARPSRSSSSAGGTEFLLLLVLVPCWLVLLGWGLWSHRLPLWAAGALVVVNLVAVWTYTMDKHAARSGTRRVSENRLHLLSLLGGWPGAWMAQQMLRHKTSKASFRAVYWLTIALHCSALALWLWRRPKLLSFL